jgi:hypothetical protein
VGPQGAGSFLQSAGSVELTGNVGLVMSGSLSASRAFYNLSGTGLLVSLTAS